MPFLSTMSRNLTLFDILIFSINHRNYIPSPLNSPATARRLTQKLGNQISAKARGSPKLLTKAANKIHNRNSPKTNSVLPSTCKEQQKQTSAVNSCTGRRWTPNNLPDRRCKGIPVDLATKHSSWKLPIQRILHGYRLLARYHQSRPLRHLARWPSVPLQCAFNTRAKLLRTLFLTDWSVCICAKCRMEF